MNPTFGIWERNDDRVDFIKPTHHTFLHKQSGGRRLPTPEWAMNDAALRRVIVTFMEERAFSKKERGALRKKAGLKERLNRALIKIISKRKLVISILDRLCEEYVQVKIENSQWPEFYLNETRVASLEREIEGIDTYLRISENGGADIVAAIVYLYYRTGLDSVGVGGELGLKPPHVRQTLFRLNQTAENIDGLCKISASKKVQQHIHATHCECVRAVKERVRGREEHYQTWALAMEARARERVRKLAQK